MNYFLTCSSGRRLRISLPLIDDARLPVVDSVADLDQMPDPPRIAFEILLGDGGDAYPILEEMLEAVRYLEEREVIPQALAAELRAVIVEQLP